jgi:4-oxalocrotonate tautomerase
MISVQMFGGRTPEQKAALAERLTDAFLETCGSPGQPRDGVWVVINEVPSEHWAVGGKLGPPATP